jgi:hypothetical protein
MRKSIRLMSIVCLLLATLQLSAQPRSITGVVLDEDKSPLGGVTITNIQTNKSTVTNDAGSFTIAGETGQTLLLSFVGFVSTRVAITSSGNVSVSLNRSASNQLADVVVVAMDLKRNARELGYSVQKVSGAEIAETQRENFFKQLTGPCRWCYDYFVKRYCRRFFKHCSKRLQLSFTE